MHIKLFSVNGTIKYHDNFLNSAGKIVTNPVFLLH
jgi:hypothetical protein